MLKNLLGGLSLVIPDKRYCFDYFNVVSSTWELLDAFEQKRKRPSSGKVFDYISGAATPNGNIALSKGGSGKNGLLHSFDEARANWEKAATTEDYIDVHNWRFVPGSFRLILHDLQRLGLTGLTIAKEFDTKGCEFYVALRKTGPDAITDRVELLNRARADG